MNQILADLHNALRGVQAFETALAICALLALTIAYVSISQVQRPQRMLLNTVAVTGLVFMGIVAFRLKQYSNAWNAYPALSDLPYPRLSEAAFVMSPLVLLFAAILCPILLVQAWRKSTKVQRWVLALGSLTLFTACLSVAAACISYSLPFDSTIEIFFNHLKVNSRDIAFLACVGFVVLAGLLAGRAITTIQAGVNYTNEPEGEDDLTAPHGALGNTSHRNNGGV